MSLLGRIGLSPESAALEGTPEEVDARLRAAHDEKLRPARVEAAPCVRGWREIADDLVPRLGGRWFVSAAMAAEAAAERLGAHTRRLVAERQVETARDWYLQQARARLPLRGRR